VIVENDIYVDLDPEARPSLASLDQLQRVVHIGSFSKTISPNIRVGYMAAQPDLLEELAQLKMLSGLTSSEFTERLAYGALVDGRWRKHVKHVRERLADAHHQATAQLLGLGFELFCEPEAGMLLWARHPGIANSAELAYKAAESDILLGPGHLFLTDLAPSPWLRFNVAFCTENVIAFLQEELGAAHRQAA
jgi:DNA-binding transcriptional MocR family regulator